MTVNEVEARTGLDRGTVRYYESEGLIKPKREANGYRNYSEADVEKLNKVKLLRSLYFSIDDIRAMDTDGGDFADRVRARIGSLEASEADMTDAKRVLERILADNASYGTLDTGLYLEVLADRPGLDGETAQEPEEPDDARWRVRVPENVYIPAEPEASTWRRFFARGLDSAIYSVMLFLFMNNVLHRPVSWVTTGSYSLVRGVFVTVMSLIFEPVELRLFGATLGKWMLGIRVTDRNGEKLTWAAAFGRTWRVMLMGEGLNIPGANLALNIRAFIKAERCLELYWESGSRLEQKDGKHTAACVDTVVVLVVLTVLSVLLAGRPANMGALTPEELAENYNGLCVHYEVSTHWSLMPDGSWYDDLDDMPPNTLVIAPIGSETPPDPLELTVEDGAVTALRYSRSSGANVKDQSVTWMTEALDQAKLLVMSLVGADRRAVSPLRGVVEIERELESSDGTGYDVRFGSWHAVLTVETNGRLTSDGRVEKSGGGLSGGGLYWRAVLEIEKEDA